MNELGNRGSAHLGAQAGHVRWKSRAAFLAVLLAATFTIPICITADEIRLKDGKKLYGEIVALDDNMYKVKTDFGYVLVEKDKIASIIPNSSGTSEPKPAIKKEPAVVKRPAPKAAAISQPQTDPGSALGNAADAATPENSPLPEVSKREKTEAILATSTAVKPQARATTAKQPVAPALRPVTSPVTAAGSIVANSAAPLPPPKEAAQEEVRGNLYINHANNFRIYKAPSWNLIEDARKALPNAIVAMGTFNESTLLVVGKEKNKEALEPASAAVEHRVREVYENYRQISRRSTTVGGLPGIEFRYRGIADDHDWSGTLVVLARGNEIFTILGMTYADTDLIQIQENVIARSIASLDFSPIGPAPVN
jgi:hypothetical protein